MDPQHLATLLRLCGIKWAVYDKATHKPVAYCFTFTEAKRITCALDTTTADVHSVKEIEE